MKQNNTFIWHIHFISFYRLKIIRNGSLGYSSTSITRNEGGFFSTIKIKGFFEVKLKAFPADYF